MSSATFSRSRGASTGNPEFCSVAIPATALVKTQRRPPGPWSWCGQGKSVARSDVEASTGLRKIGVDNERAGHGPTRPSASADQTALSELPSVVWVPVLVLTRILHLPSSCPYHRLHSKKKRTKAGASLSSGSFTPMNVLPVSTSTSMPRLH